MSQPGQDNPETEAVKHEIREEQGEAAEAPSKTRQGEEQASPEDFENDPARNPQDEALKNIKGG
jgi:hypothetical protein